MPVRKMVIELPIITDVLSPANAVGKRKIIAKDKIIHKLFDINDIEIEQYINAKTGKTINKYTGIYSNEVYYKINKPYKELKEIKINGAVPVKGFMGHSSKNYKNA